MELCGSVFIAHHPSHGRSLLVRDRAAASYAAGQTFALEPIDPGKWQWN